MSVSRYLPLRQLPASVQTSRLNLVLSHLDRYPSSMWYCFPHGVGIGTLSRMVDMGILDCDEYGETYWLTPVGLRVAYILPRGELVMKDWISER